MIQDFLKVGGVMFGTVGVLFLMIIITTLFGGIAGWTIGLVFDAPQQVATLLGLELTDFQVGALLGFVGSFFKTQLSTSSSKSK